MTLQLVEGQDFSVNYTLLQCIAQLDSFENWLALDKSSNERVLLRIFRSPLNAAQVTCVETAIAMSRGLIHPNIARLYGFEQTQGLDFIVGQIIRGARQFVPDQPHFAAQWPLLEQLFETLIFAHSLGIAHGHVHPANLLVDDQNHLYLTDFGLTSDLQDDGGHRDWLSPQARQNETPDPTDDVYSLGHLLYLGLTGRTWQDGHGFERTSTVPEEVQHLITGMLSASAWERPRDLVQVRSVVKHYILDESDPPLTSNFSRAVAGTREEELRPARATPRESRVMAAPIALAGFALLIVIAGIVFFVLPRSAQQREAPAAPPPAAQTTPASETTASPTAQQLTPLELAKREQLQKEGNDIASKLLRLQVGLEDQGVQLWAPDDYKKVLDLSGSGDDAYRSSNYQKALNLYKQGVTLLQELTSRVPAVKADNLKAGQAALGTGDYQTAIKAFTIANAIDPSDDAIKHDLARSQNLEKVLALTKDARSLESAGKIDQAHSKFTAAVSLDPDWLPAKQGLDEINARIAKRAFDDAMSVAFTALGSKQYDKARTAFQRASKILPHSTQPADGLQQVDIAVRQDKIETRRRQADVAAKAEDWHGAIAAYDKILALDPTLVFANDGLKQAKARLDLQENMQRFIDKPTLMASNDELATARKLLVSAAGVAVAGPKLQAQMDKLSQLISLARIPVPVELKSDNHTDVTVYRVGHLGKLQATSINLVPGEYTIVGRRSGYRDVRRQITVLGGHVIAPVTVSCTEKI